MPRGKTIELFFVDGTSDGIVTAELSNWNAQAIRIPRDGFRHLPHDETLAALDGVGVYFLVCKGENGARDSVYVGESETLRERLFQHLHDYEVDQEPFFWNWAVVFGSNRLDKALIRYLENRVVSIVKECDRSICLTRNTFRNPRLKPAQRESMEEFLDNVETLMPALGCHFLVPVPSGNAETVYFWCQGGGASAKGFKSREGFTVVKDSRISSRVAPRFAENAPAYSRLRAELEADGTIRNGLFTKNHEFSAPSAASSVVLGHNSSGNREWKRENGNTLGQETAMPAVAPPAR